jgi:hypothetical protein
MWEARCPLRGGTNRWWKAICADARRLKSHRYGWADFHAAASRAKWSFGLLFARTRKSLRSNVLKNFCGKT